LALISPPVGEEVAKAVESRLETRLGVTNATGEVLYEIVSGSMEGSWDSRMHVRVLREELVYLKSISDPHGKGQTVARSCPPFLRVEGSVHKAMLGHNVWGGPLDPSRSATWLVSELSRRLGVPLPPYGWRCARADWAEVYDLGSFEACEEYINGMSQARYPRRKVCRYSSQSVMFAGKTTTVKGYHKGPEFSKNDFRRLEKSVSVQYAADLQDLANRLLRFETTVKLEKLKSDHGEMPPIECVTREYLEALHDREMHRIVREGESEMHTVRRNEEVSRRLVMMYGLKLSNTLFGTWSRLVMVGEGEVRKTMARRTFYLHRKQLQDARCAWVGTDVQVLHSAIPEGFSPVRSDPRRLVAEAPAIVAVLAAA
jgi:hypothetical protein